jgi:uncharacterized SAM-binding protein YcdF (DUF218 family)
VLGFVLGALTSAFTLVGSLVAVGHLLAVSDPLAPADAIVAISGDATGARVETAIALWKGRYAPLLVFSGASLDPESAPSAELMKREAVRRGIPDDAIVVEGTAATTEENAARVAEVMRKRGLHTAILVTSPYHQRRAALLFARSFSPDGLAFRNHPADDPQWDANTWWVREPSRSLTMVELAKLGAVIVGSS